MNADVHTGAHAGARLRHIRLPLATLAGCLLWLGSCFCGGRWALAQAGTLFRCTGSSGESVFSSSTGGYHGCKKIATFAAPSRAPAAVSHARNAVALPSSLNLVSGAVETTARSLSADGIDPVSLARVRSSVESSGRLDGHTLPLTQLTALNAVHGSASSTAMLPLADAIDTGTPGQWRYKEGRDAAPPMLAPDTGPNRIMRGSVFRIVRADGSVEYTNVPPANQKGRAVTMLFSYIETCLACNLHSTIHWGSTALNLSAYADTIRAASAEYGVDEAFLRAIIHAESAFNPRALSLKGAQGLMQLMPATANDMGVLDAFNSEQNIRGGARYLSLLLHDFNGNERLAAAAYNAGPGAVVRYSGVPPYAETQVYVERVGTLRKRYGAVVPEIGGKPAG